MKESMIEQFQHRRKRSNNFTFDELLGYTNEGSDECVETQSPVSNYENIFSPMSLIADSPLPSTTTINFNSRKRQTTEVNTATDEVSEERGEFNDSGVQVDLSSILTSTPKRTKLTR